MATKIMTSEFNVLYELDKFENLVSRRDHHGSFNQFLKILNASSIHKSKPDKAFGGLSKEQVVYLATRFVAAANTMFLDNEFNLNQTGYETLQILGRNYSVIVALTAFRNSDHVIRHLVGQAEYGDKKDSINVHCFMKFLFLWSVYSDVILPFDDFVVRQPDIMKYLIFNGLTYVSYVSENVDKRREFMLELLAKDDFPLTLDDNCVAFAGPVWMYTAYANTSLKHKAKVAINKAYHKWMLECGVKEPQLPARRPIKAKPKIVVIVEQMTINHAVYRCRGPALESLKEKFEVVGMGLKDYVDDQAIKVFDDFVYFGPNILKDMKSNVGKIIKQNPDMILYISLGMQNMTIPLATMRLAPIQGCLLAHPTTTEMSTIDYVFSQESHAKGAEEFDETLVLIPDGSFPFENRGNVGFAHVEENALRIDDSPEVVKVAIPSAAMKLNSVFIKFLSNIVKKAERKIEFHFFPHVKGLAYYQLENDIKAILPNSVIHLPYGYDQYLLKIGECHLHMSPFPFGNTNGNIDSTKMGVPIIAMRGKGKESIIDCGMLRRMGMPEWVVAENEEEYEALALSLIHNDDKRKELLEFIKTIDLNEVFFTTKKDHGFVNSVNEVYLKHELIQERNIKEITLEELVELDSDSIAYNSA